ncbi:MAG: hypothetical protein R2709_04795 [Marmoricola sp.]
MSHASLHRDAIVVLREWAAPTPEQETLREGFIRLLTEYDDATARTCFPDHLTAGVIVFNPDLSKVLLNLHAKAQRWFAFGGHLEDGDETLLHAAARGWAARSRGWPRFDLRPSLCTRRVIRSTS